MKGTRYDRARNEKVIEILEIVRTLPPTVTLPGFFEVLIDSETGDPDGMYLWLAENYGFIDEDDLPFINEASEDEHYRADLQRSRNHYYRKALVQCVSGLPESFSRYVEIPGTSREANLRLFETLLSGGPVSLEVFYNYVSSSSVNLPNLEALGLHEASRRYETAKRFHQQAYGLIQAITSFRRSSTGYFRSTVQRIDFASIAEVDLGDGIIKFRADHFVTLFEGVDHNRLRLCDHCHRIFWVRRIDKNPDPDKKFGCSPECVTVLTTRKWREKTTPKQRENYKINRIAKQLRKEK